MGLEIQIEIKIETGTETHGTEIDTEIGIQ